MKFTSPGHHRSLDSFREHWQSINASLDVADEPGGPGSALGRPYELGGRTIGNRIAAHPMEGWDGTRDGLPTEHTLRRWRRFGGSGAKLIWGGEAFAVRVDGRANPNQLFLNDDPAVNVAGGLRRLRDELVAGHAAIGESADDLYVGLQLTHSGRFSRPDGEPAPRVAYRHPVLDARFGVDRDAQVLTDGELEGIGERYVLAARVALEAGFDFVDVKACHGYLLHELLGARARRGRYGGSFENRTRLFRTIVEEIRRECPGLAVGVRVSIADVHPFAANSETRIGEPSGWEASVPFEHGFGIDPEDPRRFDLTESFRFLELLSELGIRLVNLSLGSPYCPHLQRPAAYPPSDGYLPPEDPLVSVARHVLTVRRCKERFPQLGLVGTGYTYLQDWLPHVAEYELEAGHVDFVGLGRMLLVYPEILHDALSGRPVDKKRICRTFSDCTTGPRNGMISGCFPLDPYYREMPEAGRLKAIEKSAAAGRATRETE